MPVTIFGDASNLPPSATLWRYMRIPTLILLAAGKAFFPSISKLQEGDRLEGEIYCEPLWLFHAIEKCFDPESAEAVTDWLGQTWSSFPYPLPQQITDPSALSSFRHAICSRRAAWCWVQQPDESAAMWSIYANAGVAVSTTLKCLCDSLPEAMEFMLAKITYVDEHLAPVNPESERHQREVILRPHLAKLASYRHENEVWIVTRCPASEKGRMISGINSQTLVQKIVISPLLPYDEAKQLERVLREQFQNSIVERSELLGRLREQEDSRAAIDVQLEAAGYDSSPGDDVGFPDALKQL